MAYPSPVHVFTFLLEGFLYIIVKHWTLLLNESFGLKVTWDREVEIILLFGTFLLDGTFFVMELLFILLGGLNGLLSYLGRGIIRTEWYVRSR